MEVREVPLDVPEGRQLILGQAHFIKTVDDIYEALATSVPGLKFGIAFCEASGKALVRFDGSDDSCIQVARQCATKVGAGHSFVIILDGAYPINVLHKVKDVDEVTAIYCATANPVKVIIAESGGGRAVLGVVDGVSPRGEEKEADRADRHEFLRKVGYKR